MATVLVVDDDDVERVRLKKMLERDGYLVAAVPRGREALELIRTVAFDVVFSETYMEGFDGLELLHAARAIHPNVPIVLMADPGRGSYQPVSAMAALLGAAGQLVKPVDAHGLRTLLGSILGGGETGEAAS